MNKTTTDKLIGSVAVIAGVFVIFYGVKKFKG
jgi:uncharacterized membrane protein